MVWSLSLLFFFQPLCPLSLVQASFGPHRYTSSPSECRFRLHPVCAPATSPCPWSPFREALSLPPDADRQICPPPPPPSPPRPPPPLSPSHPPPYLHLAHLPRQSLSESPSP